MSFEEPTRNVVEDVIGILKRFSQHANDGPSHEAEVFKHDAREKLENFISQRQEITLVLPAFPWKNRNIEKVIGPHPDLGEELGLARIDDLCEEIRKVYMFGARVHLIADGPVYNDLVGIPDEEYYDYGVELRQLAVRKGFNSIRFLRLSDLLSADNTIKLTKEAYLASVPLLREQLETSFLAADFNVEEEIQSNADTNLTYRGYAKLVDEDLKWGSNINEQVLSSPTAYKEVVQNVAKGMIRRLLAYENLIRDRYGWAIRLSIHQSTGKTKISIPLLPYDSKSRGTPWHCSIAVLATGEIRTGHSEEFRKKYDTVEKDGRPYYFRERSPLFELEAPVEIDYEYDGLILKTASPHPISLSKDDEEKLATLILRFKSIRTLGLSSLKSSSA